MASIFFYPVSLTALELDSVVTAILVGRAKPHPDDKPDPLNTIDFSDEHGGSTTHAFAVKHDAGMDTIEVTDATLAFQVLSRLTPISGFSATPAPAGATLRLKPAKPGAAAVPARLSSVVLKCANPPQLSGGQYLVVCPADGAVPGPPLFAYPPITLGAGMYSSTSRELDVVPLGDGSGYTVTFASPPLGTGWLFQFVSGADPMHLQPMTTAVPAGNVTFGTVTIDAAPTDLAVTLSTTTGDVPVWNHPGPLYRDNGVQTIGFAPIARKQLQDQLANAAGPALPLTLTFTSASAGTLELLPDQSALTTVYVVKPLATDPATLRLGGSWVPLELSAPAQSVASARGVVRVKPRGQEVNAMTPVADADFGGAGAVVDTGRWIAVSSGVAPPSGAAANGTIALAAVRLPLASEQDSEIVVEIRADVAGLPGLVAGSAVVQLAARSSATTSFALKPAVKVVSGGAPLWVVARCTKGAVRWHTALPPPAHGAAVRASYDGGKTWRALDPGGIAGAAIPFAQLVQTVPAAGQPAVRVRVRAASGAPALADTLPIGAHGEVQFPSAVLGALAAAAPGSNGKAKTTIELASNAVADVTFSALAFVYTP